MVVPEKIPLAIPAHERIFLEDMETPAPTYEVQVFNSVMEALCRVLTKQARECFIEAPLLLLIWNRLMRLAKRFVNVAERVRTGTLCNPAPARSQAASPSPADEPRRRLVLPGEKLPTYFGWLVKMIPETERFGADICWLIQRPETQKLIFEAPQAALILRSACHMLGVEPPLAIRSPRPPPAPIEPVDPPREVPPPPWATAAPEPEPAPPQPEPAPPPQYEDDGTGPLATPDEEFRTPDENKCDHPKNR